VKIPLRQNHSGTLSLIAIYEMKRIIAVNELFNMRYITRESSNDLQTMIYKVIKNVRVLSTIDLPLDPLSEMFIFNIVAH
jgi:hypothetical protein